MAAVFIGLWLTGTELNISAMMGMTMIVGIVTEVAIFYFSEFQDARSEEEAHRRTLIAAGVNRMRPIAMTTFAAILALLPLALGIGQGSAMQQPLAIAIISGPDRPVAAGLDRAAGAAGDVSPIGPIVCAGYLRRRVTPTHSPGDFSCRQPRYDRPDTNILP